jgi:hypothetical protein
MGGPHDRFVQGTIVNGEKAGYRIRVEDDWDNTGGFLIVFENPDDPRVGGDYWVETFQDVVRGLAQLGCNVQWNQPVERLRR